MPVQLYETLFLFDATKVATDGDAVRGQAHATLERYGGEIVVNRPWDDRKLTYPIKKQKKGVFYIVYYRIESTKQADLERDYRINESILRHMTIHIDPKWEDAILDVANNDHSQGFAVRGMKEEAAAGDVMPNLTGEFYPSGSDEDGDRDRERGGERGERGGRRPARREAADKMD